MMTLLDAESTCGVTKLSSTSTRSGPSRAASLQRPSPLRPKQKRVWSMRICVVGASPLSTDSVEAFCIVYSLLVWKRLPIVGSTSRTSMHACQQCSIARVV